MGRASNDIAITSIISIVSFENLKIIFPMKFGPENSEHNKLQYNFYLNTQGRNGVHAFAFPFFLKFRYLMFNCVHFNLMPQAKQSIYVPIFFYFNISDYFKCPHLFEQQLIIRQNCSFWKTMLYKRYNYLIIVQHWKWILKFFIAR